VPVLLGVESHRSSFCATCALLSCAKAYSRSRGRRRAV
jgi:hypothetical protein